jgi:hypothetical protein
MLRAVLKKGAIVPLDPLPSEWEEGTALEIERAENSQLDIDAWAKSMDALCADSTPEDEETMGAAIDEHRRQAKAQVRREMGLSA